MLSSNVRDEISHYLGSDSKPYLIESFNMRQESICEYWDLPPQKEEDKPTHIRYQEITLRIIQLTQKDKNDPQIESLVKEANELVKGIPVTKKYGGLWISIHDLFKLDKTKGIRKEWWELSSRFANRGVCIFQGYRNPGTWEPKIADILIVMPNEDQYEFLRINQTRGNNRPVETNGIINALEKLNNEFGISIIYASIDYVEFIFKEPVEAMSIARIRQRLNRLCPSAEDLTGGIRSGRVALWWD